tara:strand:- start:85 stop:357 length:273 start_codon:yes stop_codon:yes gene_type:complete
MEDWPNVHEAGDVPIGRVVRILDRDTDRVTGVGTVMEKAFSPASGTYRLMIRRRGNLVVYGARDHRYEVVDSSMLTPEQLEEVGETDELN